MLRDLREENPCDLDVQLAAATAHVAPKQCWHQTLPSLLAWEGIVEGFRGTYVELSRTHHFLALLLFTLLRTVGGEEVVQALLRRG